MGYKIFMALGDFAHFLVDNPLLLVIIAVLIYGALKIHKKESTRR